MVIDKVERINKSVDVLLGEVGELKGKIKQHQIYVQELVKKYEGQMNTFLTKAGFKYEGLFTTMRKQESLKTPAKCNLA